MEMMTASFSRPWKPSTELISIADSAPGRSSFSRCTYATTACFSNLRHAA